MNILLIDESNLQTTLRATLLEEQSYQVTVIESYEELVELYQIGRFDVVIIDFELQSSGELIGQESLDYIDAINPKQRVITLSASKKYSDPYGCEHCVAHFNRRRLNKPTPIRNILRLIQDFDISPCDHYHTS